MKIPDFVADELRESSFVCLDVGGRGGVVDYYRQFIDILTVETFDADADADQVGDDGKRANVTNFPIGLAGRSGVMPLYVTNRASGSSLYPPNPDLMSQYINDDYGGIRKTVDIDVMKYADFRRKYDRKPATFAKIDTQGSELDILKGFDEETWDSLLGVQAEVEFAEVYKGQPLFCDLHAYMTEKGFTLFDLRTTRTYLTKDEQINHYLRQLDFSFGTNKISGRLWGGDTLYFRDFVSTPPSDRITYLKTLVLCYMFKYYDHALWLLDVGRETHVLSADEQEILVRYTKSISPVPHWPEGTGMLHRVSRKLLQGLGIRKTARKKYQTFWTFKSWPNQ